MNIIVSWIKNNPIRTMFLIPIVLVAGISISHVVSWYDLANPFNWAIYLSIAVEVGAMSALVAATNRVQGGVWFMFGLVTFIQMIGNIYFCFKEIDAAGPLFQSWLELTAPVWEMVGTDLNDTVALKRWLAFLEGGLLPIISLTSLHFFVKYDDRERLKENGSTENEEESTVAVEEITSKLKTQILEELKKEYNIKEEIKEFVTPGGRHVEENIEVEENIDILPKEEENIEETITLEEVEEEIGEEISMEEENTNPNPKKKVEITTKETATGKVKYKRIR